MNIWLLTKTLEPILISRCDQKLFETIVPFARSKTNGYTTYSVRHSSGNVVPLSRYIMNYDGDLFVDHANRETWDNTRENLRLASVLQNNQNKTRKDVHNVFSYANNLYGYVFYYKKKKYSKSNYANIKSCFLAMIDSRREVMGSDFKFYNHYDPEKITTKTKVKHAYLSKPSSHRGVRARGGKFLAEIYHKNKTFHIGSFDCETTAAEARDKKAVELKGCDVYLNFPQTRDSNPSEPPERE